MKITSEEVEHVARLTRLELSREETSVLGDQLSSVLTYFDKLNELDTTDVEPMSHAVEQINVFRSDRMNASIGRDEALDNAPARQDGFFQVPGVLG